MYEKGCDMFLTDNNFVYLPDFKGENVDYEKLVQDLGLESEKTYISYPLRGENKRMRLSQLTWEEKIQRKKLRNRIAAQTSRDRKKAKMDHLEEAVKDLKQQNELLLIEVEELKKKNDLLLDANAELQKALALRPYTCSCLQKVKEDFGVIQSFHKMEEQTCVRDGYSFERPAESSEIPQQKGHQPALAQVLADFKEDSFIDDLEKLAANMLDEVEQQECRRHIEPAFRQVTEIGGRACIHNNEMVGKASEKLEPTGEGVIPAQKQQQRHSGSSESTMINKLWHISEEHSYASPERSHFSQAEFSKRNINCPVLNIPTISISECDKISAIEKELKKGLEPEEVIASQPGNLDNSNAFLNICSPKSEVSSDQGYDSADSPYDGNMSVTDDLNEFNELYGSTFLELFPELI